MKEPTIFALIALITVCLLMAFAGLFLLARFSTLFKNTIRNELLRKNVAAWLIIFCISSAMLPMGGGFFYLLGKFGWLHFILAHLASITVTTIVVYNITRSVAESPTLKRLSFVKHMSLILFSLIITTVIVNIPFSYYIYEGQVQYLKYAVINSIYLGAATGLVYAVISYLDIERKRKFHEKELELSRMRELKSKAELDALQSKVNPHFLYNALNSIADLSITDGKKGRRMTIALADLFRYSINYNNSNYSTIRDEIEMTEVYLQIEKIRFEDKLNYSLQVEEGLDHFLVPRFLLQPLVENAVKHGLKATGQMTDIKLIVGKNSAGLKIEIFDTGPSFPDELNPGYGVKSVYDKMDLLFHDHYEIHFTNSPEKKVSIFINKLIKDESVI